MVVKEKVSMSVYFFVMITEKVCNQDIKVTLVFGVLLVMKE